MTHGSPLGRRIRAERQAAGLSQVALGVRAGLAEDVASARMSQYENSVYEPDFALVTRIGAVLGIPAAYFYCDDDHLAAIIRALPGLIKATRKPNR